MLGVKVRVWGDLALFSRPEMKVERCSYDMITPSAARGILERSIGTLGCGGRLTRFMFKSLFNLPVSEEMR